VCAASAETGLAEAVTVGADPAEAVPARAVRVESVTPEAVASEATPIKPFVAFPPLTRGSLVRRYKRFLADVEVPGLGLVTAHTPNTGRMTGCSEPGRTVYLSRHDSPGRAYPWSWEMIRMDCGLVGVNTSLPNRLVRLALSAGAVPGFPAGGRVDSEVRRGASRLDLRWTPPDGAGPECLVEVKNCSWVEGARALFPDAASARAVRHLGELQAVVSEGQDALLVILVQRPDAASFSPADGVDPDWGRALRAALAAGVKAMAFEAELCESGAAFGREIPFDL
jgi:sugar fermentation stimulation protein A